MKRIIKWGGTLTGILILLSACQQEAGQPNILFIMTDQQHAGMMSCAGNEYLETPAMDALAARGMRFEKAYSPNAVCIPSRLSMMTSYFPSAFNVSDNGDARDKAVIPQEIRQNTMGKLIQQAGYQCLYGGKTHWGRELDMEDCGFIQLTEDERKVLADSCAAFLNSSPQEPFLLVASFINPHDICYVEIDATADAYGIPMLAPQNTAERETIAEAVRLAEKAKAEGTFETLCPPLKANFELTADIPEIIIENPRKTPPDHDNLVARDVYYYMKDHVRLKWTEDDWRMHHWIYHRLTEDVDRQIGVVLEALKESGLEENTLVVFTSDHGDMDGSHRMVHKSYFYDESTRVPFIIAGPGVKRGVNEKHLISSSLDLIPTFCEYAGLEIPADIHGLSVRGIAEGENPGDWRNFVVSENTLGRMVRTSRYKYCFYKGGQPREMLIDLEKDPGEMINLALDPAFEDVLKSHREMLRGWVKESGDPIAAVYVD